MDKKLTQTKGTVINGGNTPTSLITTPLYSTETHFYNYVTVLTELITHPCVTVLPPIYKAVQTQFNNSAKKGGL